MKPQVYVNGKHEAGMCLLNGTLLTFSGANWAEGQKGKEPGEEQASLLIF